MDKYLEILKQNKLTVGLIVAVIVLVFGGFLVFNKFFNNSDAIVEEVDLPFDAEGPYALLPPRRDGNALVLQLKRTGSYDKISYELAYVAQNDASKSGEESDGDEASGADGIDRGVVGDVDTSKKKTEYEQEILFGTCSKNVCKYDEGVENGTLTLHIKKGNKAYRMVTQWRLQKPDVALGKLSSGDDHFKYETAATREDLAVVGYSIVNELTGVPKLPAGKQVLGKVYSLNVPLAKDFPVGVVTFEVAETPGGEAKIARYNDSNNSWEMLDTKIDGSKLTANATGAGIFAVLVNSK